MNRVIGKRYEIDAPTAALLGRGGMGDIYRGRDIQTGVLVAIKALKPEIIAHNPELVTRPAAGASLHPARDRRTLEMFDGRTDSKTAP